MAIHGNKSQGARTRALAEFKSGDLQVLVATDIAARGIDIAELPHVVNYELPNVPEDYVHRIGRTGRAGAEGEAVSLVCVDELKLLADIERKIKREIPSSTLEGFSFDPKAKPEPIQNGRGPRQPSLRQHQGRGRAGDKAASPFKESKPRAPATGKPANQEQRRKSPAKPQSEINGNRIKNAAEREVNGNVPPPPPKEINGNVAPRNDHRPRNVPALLGGGARKSGGRHH